MKTIKTRSCNRETYTYMDANGKKHTLTPGIDSETGVLITEEDIKMLHRMDDNEVYNNVKNCKRPVEDWEKPFIEEWKKEHPYDDLPGRSHVSLDAAWEDDDGIDDDADKGYLGEASRAVTAESESPTIERLHEVIEMLRPDQRELYQRIVINGESAEQIADEMGVGRTAIANRMTRIKEFIRKSF